MPTEAAVLSLLPLIDTISACCTDWSRPPTPSTVVDGVVLLRVASKVRDERTLELAEVKAVRDGGKGVERS